MKLRRPASAIAAIGLLMIGGISVWALGPISLNFFTPEMVDPNKVVTFKNANSQNLNGSDLVVPAPNFPATKGVELHSAIPGAVAGSIHDITSFTLSFNYFDTGADMPGTVNVQSFGAVSNFFNYDPWAVSGGLIDPATGLYSFTFTEQSTSAPVNDNFVPGPNFPHNQSFATATITGDAADLSTFDMQNSLNNVVVTPGTVSGQDRLPAAVPTPEFGSVFSLGGLLAAGVAALWLRRRRAS